MRRCAGCADVPAAPMAGEEQRRQALQQQRFGGIDVEEFRRVTQARLNGAALVVSAHSRLSKHLPQDDGTGTAASSGSDAAPGVAAVLSARSRRPLPPAGGAEAAEAAEATLVTVPRAPQVGQTRRRRIAVVGGGPVGLWVANLIALRHARRLRRSAASQGSGGFIRGPDAPQIVVFERRAQEEHCSRKNVRIVLDTHTVALLQKHTKSTQFVSGMALADIERALLDQWQRLGGKACLEYGAHISSPSQLVAEDWDLVLWAGGRWSLDAGYREALGCKMQVGECEEVLVVELRGFSSARRPGDARVRRDDLEQLAATDLTACARQAALAAAPEGAGGCSYRLALRCSEESLPDGASSALGFLWFLGLPPELVAAKTAAPPPGRGRTTSGSICEALDAELARLGIPTVGESVPRWVRRLRAGTEAVQMRLLSPNSVSLRWVDAAYWSSDRVVCALTGASGRATPLLLVGDAAAGKPFFTGTTLNMHMSEVKSLSRLPVMRWGTGEASIGSGAAPRYRMADQRAVLGPFLAHEERYRQLLTRTPGFCRRTTT